MRPSECLLYTLTVKYTERVRRSDEEEETVWWVEYPNQEKKVNILVSNRWAGGIELAKAKALHDFGSTAEIINVEETEINQIIELHQ